MTVYELLYVTRPIIDILEKNKVQLSHVDKVEMYEDWLRLKAEGHKSLHIVAHLAEVYNMSEQHVWRSVKALSREI